MNAEFEIKVTRKAMYRFLLYHTYHSASGLVSIVAGVGLLLYFFLGTAGANHWIYAAFGILLLIYLPWTLFMQAAKQTQLNPVFKKPLHYVVSESGIRVEQEEASNEIAWEQVRRVCETRQSILVYTGAKNAFIWIRVQMGSEEAAVRALLVKNVDAKRLKLKKA